MQQGKATMVKVNVIAGCLIGLCVLILSYMHTTALFDRAGYKGVFSHIGVIGFELTFVLGTVTVIWSRWIDEKVGRSARFVFWLGVIINVYSNVTSGIAKNGEPLVFFKIGGIVVDEAVLIGGLIPLLIVAAEMVVQDALLHQKQKKEVENSPLTPVKIGDSIFTKIDDSSNNVIVVSPGELDGGIVGDSKPFHIEIDDHIKQNRGLEEIAYKQESEDLIPPIKEIEKISLMKEEEITPPVIQETPENISTFSSQYGDNQEESPTENSKESSKIVMEKPSNPPAKKRKISRKKVTSTPSSSHAKSPYEIALQLYKEDGEVPGRGKLQEVAGCKEWPARQAIKQLKENIG